MTGLALCLAAVVAGNARFTLLTDRMVRCEWSEDGAFEDRPSLTFVNRDMPEVPFEWERRGEGVAIKTDRMALEWTGGAFNESNLVVNGVAVLTKDEGNLLGTKRTLDGERSLASVLPNMKLEGGLFSRRGVTVVDDTKTPLFVETDSHWRKWVEERPPRAEGSYRDLTVFAYGNDYKGGLGDYIKVAGRIPLPPRWAFGYWWSRYWLYTDTEIRELVDQMKSVDIPIDVFVIDMEWHDTWRIGDRPDLKDEFGQYWGWTGYTWNKRLFPNHKSTLKYLHDNGCKTALNLHPASGIQPVEACYDAFAKDYGWQGTNAVPYHGDEEKWATCYFKNVLAPMEADVEQYVLAEPSVRGAFRRARRRHEASLHLPPLGRSRLAPLPGWLLGRQQGRVEHAGGDSVVYGDGLERRLRLLGARHRRPHGSGGRLRA